MSLHMVFLHYFSILLFLENSKLFSKTYFLELTNYIFRWRTILYVASIPGIFVALGMQFAVDSPRWLCKVGILCFPI